jgi:hypothetical protein
MLSPEALRLAVALADIRGEMGFYNSLGYWHTDAPDPTDDWLRSLRPQTQPLTITGENEILEIRDCHANVTAPDGTTIHVYGDLDARITVTGQSEVVVAGDVLPGGVIDGDGIIRIYIAGRLQGEVVNRGSSVVWVGGNLSGRVGTGEPMTQLNVLGNCAGVINPVVGEPALLHLEVCGFMPFALLERTGAVGYTEFHAVIHRSDCPAGLYPEPVAYQQLADHRSYNRWVVLATQQ